MAGGNSEQAVEKITSYVAGLEINQHGLLFFITRKEQYLGVKISGIYETLSTSEARH